MALGGAFITLASLTGLMTQVRGLRADLANYQRRIVQMSDAVATEITTILTSVQGIADDQAQLVASMEGTSTALATIQTMIADLRAAAGTGISPEAQTLLDNLASAAATAKSNQDAAAAQAASVQATATTLATPPEVPPAA